MYKGSLDINGQDFFDIQFYFERNENPLICIEKLFPRKGGGMNELQYSLDISSMGKFEDGI